MTSRIVGVVDRLGRMYCKDCAFTRDITGTPVMNDVPPHNIERCDSCGAHLLGDECSICRSRHGREIVHACE